MRVLVVSAWSPYRPTDGDSLILGHHLRRLADHHELTVLAAEDGIEGAEPAGGPWPASIAVRSFGANRLSMVDALVRRGQSLLPAAPGRRREPAHCAWVERPQLVAALHAAVASGNVDLVYLFGWGTAQLAARAGRVPTVHNAVDTWTEGFTNRVVPVANRFIDVGQRRLVAAHETRHYPRLGAVVVVSAGEAENVRRRAPGTRVEVVVNGVEAGPDPGSVAPDHPDLVAFHGVFSTRANQDAARFLVEKVLPALQRRRPGARVLLIGRDADAEIDALAGPHVEVTGEVADVRRALQRAAVYVAPMVSGSGLKNKVLEAMAAARPVVATPLALDSIGAGEGVKSAGPDPDALAAAVADIIEDPQRALLLGRAARERVVRDFGWDRSAAALDAVWEAAVRRVAP